MGPTERRVALRTMTGARRFRLHLAANGGYVRPTERDAAPPERRDLAPLARELWSKALPLAGTPAQRYLERRRIGHSIIGRYDPAAMTYEGGKRLRLPALLLPIIERRQLVALARVFVDGDGNKHPQLADPKRTLADPRGGAVQIGAIESDHLNLAEGFEEAEGVRLPGFGSGDDLGAVADALRRQFRACPWRGRSRASGNARGHAAGAALQHG